MNMDKQDGWEIGQPGRRHTGRRHMLEGFVRSTALFSRHIPMIDNSD